MMEGGSYSSSATESTVYWNLFLISIREGGQFIEFSKLLFLNRCKKGDYSNLCGQFVERRSAKPLRTGIASSMHMPHQSSLFRWQNLMREVTINWYFSSRDLNLGTEWWYSRVKHMACLPNRASCQGYIGGQHCTLIFAILRVNDVFFHTYLLCQSV